jgi:hypothetical protein
MSTPTTGQRRDARTHRVAGVVRFADGLPAPRTKVTALDRDLRAPRLNRSLG